MPYLATLSVAAIVLAFVLGFVAERQHRLLNRQRQEVRDLRREIDEGDGTESLVRDLLASIASHPEEWTATRRTFNHKSGVDLWIVNGQNCVQIYRPEEINLADSQKKRIWEAYQGYMKSSYGRDYERKRLGTIRSLLQQRP